jgi:predicted transcriptional regulator
MTPDEIKQTRNDLGLTQSELGQMLDTDGLSIRRMEMHESASTSRKPPPRMVRLLKAYASGYRPTDWPR